MSDPRRTALLVVNQASSAARDSQRYIDVLSAGGLTLLRRDCRRDRLDDLILSMRAEIGAVILAGGDGTVGAGAVALRETGLPLGILPLGENNELAHKLGIPIEPEGAGAVILAGQTRTLDLASVNGRPYFNVATIGLTVDAARTLQRASHSRLGRLGFLWTAGKLAFNVTRFSAIVRCGATVHRVRTVQITVGNGRTYRGGMELDDQPVDPHAGFLGVYSLEPATKWGLVTLSHLFDGDAEAADAAPEVRTEQSAVVEVVTRLPQPISADGEVVTVTPARFGLLPRAVRVFAPQEPAAPAPSA